MIVALSPRELGLLSIVGLALALILSNRLRPDLVALPIGTALVETGLAARIGQAFTLMLAPAGPLALIAGLYLFTVLLTQLVGGQVAALIVGPIAVSAAVQLGVNPPAVGVAVTIACSAAFLTPIAHPVNVLMMAPGGYTFNDFLRVGLGMTLVGFLTLLLVMPLLWSL